MYTDTGTSHLELNEYPNTQAQGTIDVYIPDVDKGECKNLCSNDPQCVAAMYQTTQASSECFIYYHKINVAEKSGSTVFVNEEVKGT